MQFSKMSRTLGEKASTFKQLLEQDRRAEELYQSRVNTPGERQSGSILLPRDNMASGGCLATNSSILLPGNNNILHFFEY